jgi:hypothetical protein
MHYIATKLCFFVVTIFYPITVYIHNGMNKVMGRLVCLWIQWRTQEFFLEGGVKQIQLRTEGRENGDLEAVAS